MLGPPSTMVRLVRGLVLTHLVQRATRSSTDGLSTAPIFFVVFEIK